MILSFKHKFLFLRARKVAGTSVEIALSTLCGPKDIVPPMIAIDERVRQDMGGRSGNYSDDPAQERAFAAAIRLATPTALPLVPVPPTRFGPHMALRAMEAALERSLESFALVCVERDPYAKVISMLHMRRNFADYLGGTADDMAAPLEGLKTDFDRLVAQDRLKGLKSIEMYGGRAPRVLRYERIADDLAAFAHDLGESVPALPHAKRGPMSNTIDPLEVLRRDQIDWINDYFAAEFAAFGYTPR